MFDSGKHILISFWSSIPLITTIFLYSLLEMTRQNLSDSTRLDSKKWPDSIRLDLTRMKASNDSTRLGIDRPGDSTRLETQGFDDSTRLGLDFQ